jgi:2-keto-4-pentenoate hydratase/2-oxohepta-3-ene-1,7-dioic acid hydratase in catechol pathway
MNKWTLATVVGPQGRRAAIQHVEKTYDAAALAERAEWSTIRAILDDWAAAQSVIARALAEPDRAQALTQFTLSAPLEPRTLYCVGANYQQHVDNVARFRDMPAEPSAKELGIGPFHFLKSTNCVVPSGSPVAAGSPALDFEAELAVVIGKKVRAIGGSNALEAVAGYTIANDLSVRDRAVRPKVPSGSPFRYDWAAHKNFDGACPLGPQIVPASFVADPQALTIRTWVNGELRQSASTQHMIFSVAEIIADISSRITLLPGDVILTGTPAGVGAETGRFLVAGDRVRIEIAPLGALETHIV